MFEKKFFQSSSFLFSFLFLALIPILGCDFGCISKEISSNTPEQFVDNINPEIRNSFVRVDVKIELAICEESKCEKKESAKHGSGTIIAKDGNNSYVLTAAHVCDTSNIRNLLSQDPNIKILREYIELLDIKTNPHIAKIVDIDLENDICILKTENLEYNTIKISNFAPKIGERLLNIAAPGGFFNKNMVPIYDVIYIGKYEEIIKKFIVKDLTVLEVIKYDLYTTHAYPGSSGSMIINYHNEIVGILNGSLRTMSTITISPSWYVLKSFVSNALLKNCPNCVL